MKSDENALFVSSNGKRIIPASVYRIVAKRIGEVSNVERKGPIRSVIRLQPIC